MTIHHSKRTPFLIFSFIVLLICDVCGVECAHTLEGIHIPFEKYFSVSSNDRFNCTTSNDETEKRDSIRYYLNGAGVRSFSLLFNIWGDVKIYVASFYSTSATPLTTEASVYSAVQHRDHHLLFEFTFLRKVNQKRVADAWKLQLQHSVATEYSTYPEYEDHHDTFIKCFGPIDSGGTIAIQLLSNGDTLIYDQGYIYKGTIVGQSFQNAFLSMWFGEKPVAFDLKYRLLGLNQEHEQYHVFRSANTTQSQ